MISLISKWQLRNGCPRALHDALRAVAEQVKKTEQDTWMYSVHLPGRPPLNGRRQPYDPPLAPISMQQQTEVVFFEIYKDANAFSAHVNGDVFTRFRTQNINYFYENPDNPGWPLTQTQFLERESAFIRKAAKKHC